MSLGSIKSTIKRNRPIFLALRPFVFAARKMRKFGPRPLFRAVRPILWKIQKLKEKTSEQVGLPSKIGNDIFQYIDDNPSAEVSIDLLHPAYTPKLPELITDGSDPHWRFATRREVIEPPHYVISVRDGRVFGDAMTPILQDDTILVSESYEWDTPDPFMKSIFQRFGLGKPMYIEGKVGILGTFGDDNYFHWMIHTLPRLDLLRRSKFGNGIDALLIQSGEKSFMKETLALLGVENSQLINIRKCPHIKARELLIPTTPSINGLVPKFACDFLKRSIPPAENYSSSDRIYISRETAGFRKVLNEDELTAFLEKRGFQKAVMDRLTVREQAAIHRNAKVIVGPHGANLTNILFCEPGTKLLEIFPPNFVPMCYWRMAFHAGIKYGFMLGEGENLDIELSSKNAFDDIVVDTKKVGRALDNLGVS